MATPRSLAPAEAKSFLIAVDRLHPELMPLAVMALFIGLHLRDALQTEWQAIDIEQGRIKFTDIRNGRFIEKDISPTAQSWLNLLHKDRGPIAPARSFSMILKQLKQCAQEARICNWTQNSLRRTYCTYLAPEYVRVKIEETEAFWNLTPACLFPAHCMVPFSEL